jgi:hypothetical protein
MRYRVTRGAVFDGVEAREWYRLENPDRAQRSTTSYGGSSNEPGGTHESATPTCRAPAGHARGFPYFVVYELQPSELLIVAVAHTSREAATG